MANQGKGIDTLSLSLSS